MSHLPHRTLMGDGESQLLISSVGRDLVAGVQQDVVKIELIDINQL